MEPLELSLSNNLQSLLNKKGKTLKRRRFYQNMSPELEISREKRAKQLKEVESIDFLNLYAHLS